MYSGFLQLKFYLENVKNKNAVHTVDICMIDHSSNVSVRGRLTKRSHDGPKLFCADDIVLVLIKQVKRFSVLG